MRNCNISYSQYQKLSKTSKTVPLILSLLLFHVRMLSPQHANRLQNCSYLAWKSDQRQCSAKSAASWSCTYRPWTWLEDLHSPQCWRRWWNLHSGQKRLWTRCMRGNNLHLTSLGRDYRIPFKLRWAATNGHTPIQHPILDKMPTRMESNLGPSF
jgi:hypothetical protein